MESSFYLKLAGVILGAALVLGLALAFGLGRLL